MAKINKAHTRKVDSIFGAAKEIKVFTLHNDFSGEESTKESARKALASDGAWLAKVDETKYTIHVHSNRWFYLYV